MNWTWWACVVIACLIALMIAVAVTGCATDPLHWGTDPRQW
jgi:hypothetical protein